MHDYNLEDSKTAVWILGRFILSQLMEKSFVKDNLRIQIYVYIYVYVFMYIHMCVCTYLGKILDLIIIKHFLVSEYTHYHNV